MNASDKKNQLLSQKNKPLSKPQQMDLSKESTKILVRSDGGPKREMTVVELDREDQKQLKKAIVNAPPGAEVKILKCGETTQVITHIPEKKDNTGKEK